MAPLFKYCLTVRKESDRTVKIFKFFCFYQNIRNIRFDQNIQNILFDKNI